MSSKKFKIKKESGEMQDFSRIKFINSLKRSGLEQKVADEILKNLGPRLKDGISTKRLYRMAHKLIRKNSNRAASRYALPRALLVLGPDGFNFEKFVAGLMVRLGYDVEVGTVLHGRCVTHEIDVIARKAGHTIFMECKFHNDLGFKENIKTALYVNARKMDLAANKEGQFDEFWLVTNSKLTVDAETYSACVGLTAVSPYGSSSNSLYDLVVKAGAHPIGCITQLRKKDQSALVGQGIIFVKDLLRRPKSLSKAGIKPDKIEQILKEARTICSPF